MMVNGRGGPASPAEARELFEKAAAKGHAGAMFALGAMYGRGHNMPMDRQAALRWFRAAAGIRSRPCAINCSVVISQAVPRASQTQKRHTSG